MAYWSAKLSWLHYRSLLWRFLLIGLASLSPLVGALIQFAGDEHQMALKNTRLQAELLISYAVESQHHIIEEAQSMLSLLASASEVRAGGATCDEFLARHLALHRWMSGLRLLGRDGGTLCGASDGERDPEAGRRNAFSRALQERRFTLSDPAIEESTGHLSMVATMPVIKAGEIIGVISVNVSLTLFDGLSNNRIGSNFDINLLIVDRQGVLLGHYPPLKELVGTNLQDWQVVRQALELRGGNAEASDLAGVQRLFVFRELPGTQAVLALGLERESVSGSINQALYYRLFLIALIISGSFLLGGLGAEILIFRPLRSLVQTAGELARGNFNARSPHEGAGEVGILARALNRMAEAIADRERALSDAKNVAEQALNEARLANNAKTDFLASMSHEIRTPLNGILGYTGRLLDETLTEPQRRYAELIQVAGSSLLTIANDVLDFSSLEANQTQLRIEPFSLRSLINDTVSLVASGVGRNSVPINVVSDADAPDLLYGDEARLRQILLNLLNNAVKFTKEGSITVRTEHKGACGRGELIRVSIVDTGIGIPRDKFDRLFKRFSQVDRSIRREFGGTGLGLAISKRLIELMGGEIGVESEEGRGSTFWIEVPLPQVGELAIPPVEPGLDRGSLSAQILLAEDIEINQELAKSLLVAAGHKVDVVCDGNEAVAAVQRKRYDLVLMDVQMPGADGITATKRIRALPYPASQVVIIAMTANVLPQQVRSFMEAGMNDYVGKPISRSELFGKLNAWLSARRDTEVLRGEHNSDLLSCLDQKEFEDFRDMMGADQVKQWLLRLDSLLVDGFDGDHIQAADRDRMARNAHAVVSQAALLGFSGLAELCASLERAHVSGEDLAPHLEEVRKAARNVRFAISKMNAQAA